MANAGPDTNKAQFFITYSKQSHLDGKYTILGKQVAPKSLNLYFQLDSVYRVIDGADSTLDAMEKVPVNEKNRPLQEIRLSNVTYPCPFIYSLHLLRLDM